MDQRERNLHSHTGSFVSHWGNFNSQGLHRLTTAASFTHSPAIYTPPTHSFQPYTQPSHLHSPHPSFQPYTQPSGLRHPHPSLLAGPGVWILFDTISPLMHPKLCEVNFYFWKRKLVFHSCQRLATLKTFLMKEEHECWLKTVNKTEAAVFSKSLCYGLNLSTTFEVGHFSLNQTWVTVLYWNHWTLPLTKPYHFQIQSLIKICFVQVVLYSRSTDNVERL